jgi:hypothetical protein
MQAIDRRARDPRDIRTGEPVRTGRASFAQIMGNRLDWLHGRGNPAVLRAPLCDRSSVGI